MIIRQKVLYFLSSLLVLVIIGLFEFFVVSYFVDMITTDWLIRLILFMVSLIFINPFIGIYIINKIPFEVKGLTDIEKLKTTPKA